MTNKSTNGFNDYYAGQTRAITCIVTMLKAVFISSINNIPNDPLILNELITFRSFFI